MKRLSLLLLIPLSVCGLHAEDDTASAKPNFFARRDYPGLYAQSVQAADTNGDGIPDMIAFANSFIDVELGNGDGTFAPTIRTSKTIIDFTYSFVPVDLNGDKKIDLVIPGSELDGPGGIAICYGNGDGTFQSGTF